MRAGLKKSVKDHLKTAGSLKVRLVYREGKKKTTVRVTGPDKMKDNSSRSYQSLIKKKIKYLMTPLKFLNKFFRD